MHIVQHGAGGDDAHIKVLNAKAFERRRAELLLQQLMGEIGGKRPVVEGVTIVFLRKLLLYGTKRINAIYSKLS